MNPAIDWRANSVTFSFQGRLCTLRLTPTAEDLSCGGILLTAQQFVKLAHDTELPIFAATLKGSRGERPSAIDVSDLRAEFQSSNGERPSAIDVSDLCEEFQDVFEEPPDSMPPHKQVDHEVHLEPGARPPNRGVYRM